MIRPLVVQVSMRGQRARRDQFRCLAGVDGPAECRDGLWRSPGGPPPETTKRPSATGRPRRGAVVCEKACNGSSNRSGSRREWRDGPHPEVVRWSAGRREVEADLAALVPSSTGPRATVELTRRGSSQAVQNSIPTRCALFNHRSHPRSKSPNWVVHSTSTHAPNRDQVAVQQSLGDLRHHSPKLVV